jgi:transposase
MTNYREILRLNSQGFSQRNIATSAGCARSTVERVLERARKCGITFPLPEKMSDSELAKALYPETVIPSLRKLPDYEHIHKELAKSGVTMSLLWDEYCEQCRMSAEIPFMYTQFCLHYREYAIRTKATMHIDHKPGEKLEVDWAGDTAHLIDTITGEAIPAYIFVAALSCSGYAYVEAFLSQNQESWTAAHVNAYKYFGGATKILVPDNLRTGVDRSDRYTPVINRTYQEMSEHYGTCVIPARVQKPKDKPRAEGTVGVVSTWIVASLRNRQFFSLYELNEAIHEKLEGFNCKPFQKKPGSRLSAFLEEEKEYLLPLPKQPYELATWKVATVQYNYHIAVDHNYYSIPCEYIKQKLDVRLTKSTVEGFYQGNRVCSHVRLHGRPGQYSTVVEHMPESHQKYMVWDGDRFISWAKGIGPNTQVVVKGILASHKIEQQGYRSCMALLKLADKYSVTRLESACARALSYTPDPRFKSIQTILQTGHDKLEIVDKPKKQDKESFGFTRGAAYYGGEPEC